ncbi:MAG: hypothetical protein PVS3B1_34730 [Ktedonobacteraceae bacterium]
MTFNCKVRLVSDRGELTYGETYIYLDNAAALSTGQVMVMVITANTIVVGSIGKFDAVEQTCIDQHLY